MMNNNLYVQYGCGYFAPENWFSYDASPTLRIQKIPLFGKLLVRSGARFPKEVLFGDILRGLPLPDQSCKGVYCSHVLEHLSLADFRTALKNSYSLLQPGGIFRLVMPDLENLVEKYQKDVSDEASIAFMRESCMGWEHNIHNINNFLHMWLGNCHHLWLWDFKSLKKELAEAGFVDIRRAVYHDSQDREFDNVEQKDRWNNLGAECFRPKYC